MTAYTHKSLISRHHTLNKVLLSVYLAIESSWTDNTNLSLRQNRHGCSELVLVLPQIGRSIIQEEKISYLRQDIFGSVPTEQVSVTTEGALIQHKKGGVGVEAMQREQGEKAGQSSLICAPWMAFTLNCTESSVFYSPVLSYFFHVLTVLKCLFLCWLYSFYFLSCCLLYFM